MLSTAHSEQSWFSLTVSWSLDAAEAAVRNKRSALSSCYTCVLEQRDSEVANSWNNLCFRVEKMAATVLGKGTRKCLSQEMKGQHPVWLSLCWQGEVMRWVADVHVLLEQCCPVQVPRWLWSRPEPVRPTNVISTVLSEFGTMWGVHPCLHLVLMNSTHKYWRKCTIWIRW